MHQCQPTNTQKKGVSFPDLEKRFGYLMAKSNVFETLNESQWGLRKCCFVPQTLALGAQMQTPSVPFLLRGSWDMCPPLSLLKPVVVSSSARRMCSLSPGADSWAYGAVSYCCNINKNILHRNLRDDGSEAPNPTSGLKL